MGIRFAFTACCGSLLLCGIAAAECQPSRRALVVGINTYSGGRPPALRIDKPLVPRTLIEGAASARPFENLDGAVNDATDFADLLESAGYDFPQKNVVRLLEEKATAQNILDTFQRHLVDNACPGDAAVFFYSGHGSQIRNRYIKDENAPDRFDQTLVPYDAADGVPDIRNKELDRLYLAAARKGVYLTVIADSCQSGGLSRGVRQFAKGKAADPDRRWVVDPGPRDDAGKPLLPTRAIPGIAHPVLLLAAAYETEEAKEDGESDRPHGAFTAALLRELQDHGVHESIGALFAAAKFAVGLKQPNQHPQIYGDDRLASDIFGGPASSVAGMLTRVKTMQPDGNLLLDKGTLAGLYPHCELVNVSGAAGVRLEIQEEGTTTTHAVAAVKDGSFTANPQGATFRLDKWVVPDKNALTVYYAKDGPSAEALAKDAAALWSAGLKLITDPTAPQPAGSAEALQISWLNGQWRLLPSRASKGRDLGKSLDPRALHELAAGAPLYVNFPLPAADAAALQLGDGTENDAVRVQSQPDQPHKDQYVLAGRWTGSRFEYAWVRPGITEADQSDTNLPVRTDWAAAGAECAATLRAKALALNRIYGWMTLDVPGGGSSGAFPYHLSIRKAGSSASLVSGRDVTTEDEDYRIFLTADPAEIAAITKTGNIQPRWVYVIAIDCDGAITPVIPHAASNVGNHLPEADTAAPEIPMSSTPYDFSVGDPYGLDTYILLTSEDELDPTMFAAEGVRTRAAGRGAGNPLADLLGNIGASSQSRGTRKPVPSTWSIERITVRSQPKSK